MTPGQRQYQDLMATSSKPGQGNNHCNRRAVVFDRLFAPEECEAAVRSFDCYPQEPGLIGRPVEHENPDSEYRDETDSALRDCLVTYAPRVRANDWLHERLEWAMAEANETFWRYDITDYSQPIRLMTYKTGHHFGALHQDFGPGDTCYRKLTAVMQATDPSEYEGGEFEMPGEPMPPEALNQGSVIVFPAYLIHHAKAVTSGMRQTIIHRAIGPVFK